MSIPRTTARKLCTDVEFRLVDESFGPRVNQLTEKALAQRISRARTARDKYRSLAERQVRETRGRIAPKGKRPAQGNDNTVLKQTIFDQALARYEKHLAPSAAHESSTSKKSVSKAPQKTKAINKNAASKSVSKKSVSKKTVSKKAVSKNAVSKQSEPKPAAGQASDSKKSQGTLSASEKPVVKKSASKKSAMSPSDAKKLTAEKRATKKPIPEKTLRVKLPTLSKLVADVAHVVAEREAENAADPEEATAPDQNAGSSMAGPPPGRTSEHEAIPGPNPKGPEFSRMPHERGRQSAMQKQAQARRDGR